MSVTAAAVAAASSVVCTRRPRGAPQLEPWHRLHVLLHGEFLHALAHRGHFPYRDAAKFSAEQHAALLGALTTPMRDELLGNLETEAARRRSVVSQAAARKARVAAEYAPLHPELWTLSRRAGSTPTLSHRRGRQGAVGQWRTPPAQLTAAAVCILPPDLLA